MIKTKPSLKPNTSGSMSVVLEIPNYLIPETTRQQAQTFLGHFSF